MRSSGPLSNGYSGPLDRIVTDDGFLPRWQTAGLRLPHGSPLFTNRQPPKANPALRDQKPIHQIIKSPHHKHPPISFYLPNDPPTMRKLLLFIVVCLIASATFSQNSLISVLGDNVPVYEQADYDAAVISHLGWDHEVEGVWENGWYTIILDDSTTGYISKWDGMEKEILNDPVRAKRIAPSAETLFRMMKFFKNQGKNARAEEYAIRIINDFQDEEYPTKDGCFQDCPPNLHLYGVNA